MCRHGCTNGSKPLQANTIPKVAIVGRPNVGKSTLFNRLARRRRSITHATPGVTRDPVEAICEIGDRKVMLIDTGGYRPDWTGIDGAVAQKSLETLEDADVVLLMVDVTGITAEDEEFISRIRRYSDRLILVVNKVDNEAREGDAWDFHSLGFGTVVPVSSEHGLNFDTLATEILGKLPERGDGESEDEKTEISLAILGKPNTGKSTLLNQLLGFERSIVSEVPGTTRDTIEARIEYKDHVLRVVDTAGIRRKGKVTEDVEYYSVNRAISSIGDADIIVLVVDALEGLSDQDKKIASLVVKRGRGIIMALNKWDLLPAIGNQENAISDRVRYLFPILDFAPLLPLSALNGTGVPRLLETMMTLWDQLHTRVPTGKLNQALQRWVEQDPPPYGKSKRFRVRYLTQVSHHPVSFTLFVNRAKGFPQPWISFLKNRIREEFGFDSIPISVELRGR